jgi:hypothetical protein
MNRVILGTVTGLVLGLTVVFRSFGEMLIVALFAVIGYLAAKVVNGDIDLQGWLSRSRRDR